MVGRVPTVFISSTFYDLRQVRTDLFHFIETEQGYRTLASEYPSFPVDPDTDAIENCRRRVENDADCFVLIIGSRYGSVPEHSTISVTNIEYQIARLKGIPIYPFVQKEVLSLLPIWEANPTADFSRTVDTPALFTFIQEVRSGVQPWTFPFETAQDIIDLIDGQRF